MSGSAKVVFEEGNKCAKCTQSICCTYTTQEIPAPRSKDDFDHMLWQMAHQDIQIYKDEDGWFLVANNECRFLLPTGGCQIHATRPQVCRDYSNDFCEYDEPAEKHFDHYFKTYENLLTYCRKRFKNWDKRFVD
ncbi:MAG: YkgJ family cysteine cluster protein [Gammaproteobacteria bacterium]|nr:YkgJ family cysteine cluster protein [Gammaproteobacteria bacterium]